MLIRNDASHYPSACAYILDRLPASTDDRTLWREQRNGAVVSYNYIGSDPALRKWSKSFHERYGVTTWIYTGDADDLRVGRVGTDGRTIIKFVNHDNYDFIRTEDFIKRGGLHILGFKHQSIHQKYLRQLSNEQIYILIDWLNARETQFQRELEESCALDVAQMTSEDCVEYFTPRCKSASTIIATLYADLVDKLHAYQPNINKSEIIADLELAEKLHIIDRGRPAYIKVGTMYEDGKLMVSAQFPQGQQTVPSSYRGRQVAVSKERQQLVARDLDEERVPLLSDVGDHSESGVSPQSTGPILVGPAQSMLSNHVVDLTATIYDEEIVPQIEVIGHSSYPPIGVKDELTRRYLAYYGVLENIKSIASRKISSLSEDESDVGSAEKPLKIQLSSMLLLTPFVNKWIDGLIRKLESEDSQAAESAMAIEMIRHQPQPMKIEINGRIYHIHIDISYMNIPVNVSGIAQGVLSGHSLQHRINSRGFFEYCQRIQAALSQRADGLSDESVAVKEIKQGWNSLQANLINDAVLLEQIKDLNDAIKRYENQLNKLHQESLSLFEQYLQATDVDAKEQYKKQYKVIRRDIVEIEDVCHAYYSHILHRKKVLFDENQTLIDRLHDLINQFFESCRYLKDQYDFCVLLQRFLRAQKMFYHKEYQDYLYHFQVLYLLTNAQAGGDVETFCKSAEDRTGWCRIMIMAYTAFIQQQGRDPDFHSKADLDILQKHSIAARQLSTSFENTEENSDARGTQVEPTTTGVKSNSICNQNAKLAKGVIKEAKKISKSRDEGFFSRHPIARDLLIGVGIGLLVVGLIVGTVATMGALAPALGVTLGALAVVGGSVAGTCGIAVGVVAGLGVLGAVTGVVKRNSCSDIEMKAMQQPNARQGHDFRGSSGKIRAVTHAPGHEERVGLLDASSGYEDSDIDSDVEYDALMPQGYDSDVEQQMPVPNRPLTESDYLTEYSL